MLGMEDSIQGGNPRFRGCNPWVSERALCLGTEAGAEVEVLVLSCEGTK